MTTVPDAPVEVTRQDAVVMVRMTDSAQRNAFTPALATGVADALTGAEKDPTARAIVLAGLPELFSSGATQDTMGEVVLGQLSASNADAIVRSPARAALPVVAAVRGHAIGGGLLLGLYSDVVVLSERSYYSVPFVRYGLTPVQGSTTLLRNRFGELLGTELLLTGRRYQGRELRRRGVPVMVVPHDEVEPAALAIAEEMSHTTRLVLELLKQQLAASLLAGSDEAMAAEQTMLDTALTDPETRNRMAEQWQLAGIPTNQPRSRA